MESTKTSSADFKLEVVVIPVSDVDRAKRFYCGLGWRLDADFSQGDDFRVVQFTPPGSPTSIHFGKGVTSAASGSAQRLYLVVSDVEAARASSPAVRLSARCSTGQPSAGRMRAASIRSGAAIIRSRRLRTPTAIAGCCRR